MCIRDSRPSVLSAADRANPRRRIYTQVIARVPAGAEPDAVRQRIEAAMGVTCLLYTSDAADERSSVDLGGRRIIKNKKQKKKQKTHTRADNM